MNEETIPPSLGEQLDKHPLNRKTTCVVFDADGPLVGVGSLGHRQPVAKEVMFTLVRELAEYFEAAFSTASSLARMLPAFALGECEWHLEDKGDIVEGHYIVPSTEGSVLADLGIPGWGSLCCEYYDFRTRMVRFRYRKEEHRVVESVAPKVTSQITVPGHGRYDGLFCDIKPGGMCYTVSELEQSLQLPVLLKVKKLMDDDLKKAGLESTMKAELTQWGSQRSCDLFSSMMLKNNKRPSVSAMGEGKSVIVVVEDHRGCLEAMMEEAEATTRAGGLSYGVFLAKGMKKLSIKEQEELFIERREIHVNEETLPLHFRELIRRAKRCY